MKKALLLVCLCAGVSLAASKSYNITLVEPSVIGGKELKPGSYKVEVMDQKVVIRGNKDSAEAPIKVENADSKYNATTVRYGNGDGKYRVQEIHLAGTRMNLVVEGDSGEEAGVAHRP
jgi:hypothetical protein